MNFQEFKQTFEKVAVEHYPNEVTEKPRLSVVVQTYQQAPFIRQCLDGILMQEVNFDYEILLGEDQSSDGTREICKEYAEKYPEKIRLFLHARENNIKVNGNPTGRFNYMYNLFAARGEYIAICEGDDYWKSKDKLQRQLDFLNDHQEFSLCGHKVLKLTIGSQKEEAYFEQVKTGVYTKREASIYNLRIPTASLFFRNYILENGLPDWFRFVYGGDRATIYTLSTYGKLNVMDFEGAVYKVGVGVENQYQDQCKKALRNISEYKIYHSVVENQYQNHYSKRIIRNYAYLIYRSFKSFSFIDATKYFYAVSKFVLIRQ